MRPALPLLLIACVSCSSHDGDAPDAARVSQRVAAAKAYFAQLADEPVRLPAEDFGSDIKEEAVNWLHDSIPRSPGDEFIGFIIRRLDPQSTDSYAMRLYRRTGYTELDAGKSYIEVQALRAVSDPEVHAIVDVNEMKIVVVMLDGGA